MKYKLKSGVQVQLHEQDMKNISKMYSQEFFDSQKLKDYFHEMHKKAHMNLEMISEQTIESQKDLKAALAMVMKYGSADQIADYIIQAIECKVSKMILESME